MHDTYDETTSVRDTTLPLGEFLDEQLARARENEIIEDAIISIISKNFKKINKTKVIQSKNGNPITDCVFEVDNTEKYNVYNRLNA